MPRNFILAILLFTVMLFAFSCEQLDEDSDGNFEDGTSDVQTSARPAFDAFEETGSVIEGAINEYSGIATSLDSRKLYEAENRTASNGCQQATNHSGYTGSGFMDYGGKGTWIEWNNVNAIQAGDYELTFRYGVGGDSRQSAVIVNGSNKGNLGFVNTGSWTNWKTNTKTVALRQGNNTIRVMANTSAGGPNLDNMTVASKEDPIGDSSHCALADENKAAILACPPGETIVKIDFASYGLPSGSCDSGFSINGSCHAAGSQEKVESLCLGQTGKIVSAKNTVFGDPCPGKYKKLAVQFRCSGDQIEPCTNTLLSHEKLLPGEHICSQNGNYQFGLTANGELVIRSDTKKLWSAGTFGSNVHVIMQGDGNLVVYDNVSRPLWDTKTHGNSGATLKLENDGRVVIRLGGNELWSEGGEVTQGEGFTFFAAGDSRTHQDIFKQIVSSMVKLDPNAIAIFNSGDLTTDGSSSKWKTHMSMMKQGSNGLVRADMTNFSSNAIRYVGALGNHDDGNSSWFSNWNKYLPGQKNLGSNSKSGIYFSLKYSNAIFIVLDSVHPSTTQKNWLKNQLINAESSNIRWKFVFFHHPIYPCNTKSPFDSGAKNWVELFEQYNVDIVFVADSHTYERTCPMIMGKCDPEGVVYLNSSCAGAPMDGRKIDGNRSDYAGDDRYHCSEILKASKSGWNHYCHFRVSDNQVVQKCYSHNSTSNPKYTWTLQK